MKWKLLLIGLVTIGLLAGGTASVLAGSAADQRVDPASTFTQQTAGELICTDEIEILPVVTPEDKLSIDGGFRGVWGTESETDSLTGHQGYIAGLYGSVTKADGTAYNYMGGVYTHKNGKLGGFLVGKYADGCFWGTWYSATGEANGQYKGTYGANTDSVEAILNNFEGEWQTSDGARTGYLKGKYSAKVSIEMTGDFTGKWDKNDGTSVEAVAPEADGKLEGHFGVIHLADETSLHYFRGGWSSDEGLAKGKLQGIGVRGHFYGIWNNTEGKPAGYLIGKYGENRFRGVWGTMREEPQGNLWGRYGQGSPVKS